MEENIANKLEESGIKIGKPEEEQEALRFPRPPQRSKFYGQPVNWQKSAGILTNLDKMQEEYDQQVFHRTALNQVRKALGPKCKHLVHVQKSTGEVYIKAKLEIDGKITTFNVTLDESNPADFTANTYKGLNDTLQKYLHVQRSEEAV